MKTILLVVVLTLLVSLINGYITAKFSVTTARYNYGFYTGTFYYDYATGYMKLVFPQNDLYSELFIFNANKGYGPSTPNPFSGQYLYKTSATCPCETTLLQKNMPDFEKQTNFIAGATELVGNVNAVRYSSGTASPNKPLVTDIWLVGNKLAQFKLYDNRLFTIDLSTYDTSVIAQSIFAAPTNCKCGKPLDIVLSLDRTGSIDLTEWQQEKIFTQNLTRSFDYGTIKTNLAIINWNKVHWVTIPLTAGTSAEAVSTAVNAMGCCGSGACCCCGTDIGGGLYAAGQMLLTSNRATATKAIILLTDGCQNHIYDETKDPPVIPCDCSSEALCASNDACISDITRHYLQVKQWIPSVKVIVVGVGDALCTKQLELAAGGIIENVYSTVYWDQLSTLVTSLAATACTVDDDLCTGCCGFCSCGVCITPQSCTAPDPCSVAAPDPSSGGCCAVTPKVCTPSSPCFTSVCDVTKGGCVETPKLCRPPQMCTNYTCDPSTPEGSCMAIPLTNKPECMSTPSPIPVNTTAPPTPPPAPNCVKDSECDYGDKCIKSSCLLGECYYETVKCLADDACTQYKCQSSIGCTVIKQLTCNDNDKCTTDRCDPIKGCQFTTVNCPPTMDNCTIAVCNAGLGCFNTSNTCASLIGNCTVGICTNGSCRADNVCKPPPPPTELSEVPPAVVLGSSLGAAAVVAIIVCVIIALCGLGGGAAYAVSQAGAGGGAASTTVNPLYKASGNQGTNPLYKT